MADEEEENTSHLREVRHWSNGEDDGISGSSLDSVPSLETGKVFDLILASDVTYFRSAVVSQSLEYHQLSVNVPNDLESR